MIDLRCRAVRVMHDEYLHSVPCCMVMSVRSLQGVKTRCQAQSHLHEDIEFLAKTPDERTHQSAYIKLSTSGNGGGELQTPY